MLGTDKLVNGSITHENEKGFKHIEEMARIGFVSCLKRLSEDLNHEWKEALEGFLLSKLEKDKTECPLKLTMSALSSVSIYWAMVPRDLATGRHAEWARQKRTAHLTVVTRTSALGS